MSNTQNASDGQCAFVLHSRPYRESSLLVELFTQHSGRIAVVAKGARRPRSPFRSVLQPFSKLDVRWRGRGALPTLCAAEPLPPYLYLPASATRLGFYLNELLMCTLAKSDENQQIFALYERTLARLAETASVESTLRYFEKHLLESLGYGINFDREAETQQPIEPQRTYYWAPQRGFICAPYQHLSGAPTASPAASAPHAFLGTHLLAIARDAYGDPDTLTAAKRLFRLALRELLGTRVLHARRLFPAVERTVGIRED